VTDTDKDENRSKPAGRVRHDPGGRAVWEWAVESGRNALDSTSRLLKKLNLSGLHLLDDSGKPVDRSATGEDAATDDKRPVDPQDSARRGFNPYDSRTVARNKAPGRQQQQPKPRITQPVRPAKRPGLLARLFGAGKR
jgi:hypothetical protein